MKSRFLVLLPVMVFLFGCTISEKEKEVNAISKLERVLKAEKDVNKELASAEELIQKSIAFAEKYPEDTTSASLLFKAADVARGIGENETAIALWGKVNAEYENHKTATEAIFLQAFTYDQGMNDKVKAKQYYKFFMEKYPDHQLIKDVKLMLKQYNESKSDLELIKECKKKNEGAVE